MQKFLKAVVMATTALAGFQGYSNVTVVTHGFQFANSYPDWIDAMGTAIAGRAGLGTTVIRMEIDRNSSGFGELGVTQLQVEQGKLPTENGWSGSIVVKLFWNRVAGVTDPYNTREIAETVEPFLTSPIQLSNAVLPPLSRFPFHFIGHSRGGSLVCELAVQLADEDIWVDHITMLDPHPAIADPIFATDLPLMVPDNVIFIDNYYQTGEYPSGESVPGSAEVKLDHRGAFGHSEIHEWYLGTIQPDLIHAAPPYWYTALDLGYGLSAVAHGRRFRKEITSEYSGKGLRWEGAPRTEVGSHGSGIWPNAEFHYFPEPFFWNGQEKHLTGLYSGNGSIMMMAGFDDDRNPFNNTGNAPGLFGLGFVATPNEVLGMGGGTIFSPAHNGRYLYVFVTEAESSDRSRYFYSDQKIQTEDFRFLETTVSATNISVIVNGNGISLIHIESSSDLRSWQPMPVTTNTFFSIDIPPGAERLFLRGKVE